MGKPIEEMDDFKDIIRESDDEERLMDDEIVEKLHFGGMNEEEGDLLTVKKTREQVFAEIILKSK